MNSFIYFVGGKRSESNYETDETLEIFLLFFRASAFNFVHKCQSNPFSINFYLLYVQLELIRFYASAIEVFARFSKRP